VNYALLLFVLMCIYACGVIIVFVSYRIESTIPEALPSHARSKSAAALRSPLPTREENIPHKATILRRHGERCGARKYTNFYPGEGGLGERCRNNVEASRCGAQKFEQTAALCDDDWWPNILHLGGPA
jgi:hypothetical protein